MHNMNKRIRFAAAALLCAFMLTLLPAQASQAAVDYSMVRVRLSVGSVQSISAALSGRYFVQESDAMINGSSLTVRLSTAGLSVTDGSGTELYRGSKATIIRLDDQQGKSGLITMNTTAHGKRNYLGHMEFRANGNEIMVINIVPLEQYLQGVVAHEMSNTWPIEALKAQAVAARCYVTGSMRGSTYDLGDTASDQVYKGYNAEYANVARAVAETQYQVMMYGNEIIRAYYAASNGGQTELASNAWSSGLPYLTMKDDPYDLRNPFSPKAEVFFPSVVSQQTPMQPRLDQYLRTKAIPAMQAMGIAVSAIEQIQIVGVQSLQTHTPKYAEPSKSHQQATAVLLIATAGFQNVTDPNTGEVLQQPIQQTVPVTVTFNIQDLKDTSLPYQLFTGASSLRIFWGEPVAGGFKIYNVRYGHGVGMSQRGAQQMANEGMRYDQILNFYYTGIRIVAVAAQPAPAPVPKSAVAQGATIGVVITNTANMRSGAKTSSTVLYKLTKGTQVEVVGQSGSWYQVKYKNKTGYISGELLQLMTPAATPQPTDATVAPQMLTGVITTNSVNVRQGPGTNYAAVGKLNAQTPVIVLSQANGWCQIQASNISGYVSADYVRLDAAPAATPAPGNATQGPVPTLNPANFYGQVINTESLVMRNKGSDSGKEVAKIPQGYVVQVFSQSDTYYKISYDGKNGFVRKEYLQILAQGAPHPNPAQLAAPEAKLGTVKSSATVYDKASSSGKKLGKVSKGDQLTYLGTSGSYCKVLYNGQTGYIASKYFTKPK